MGCARLNLSKQTYSIKHISGGDGSGDGGDSGGRSGGRDDKGGSGGSDSVVEVSCIASGQKWLLKCIRNEWKGVIGNCSEGG